MMDMPETGTRCGFVGLAGRPNAGKSTLVNALVGSKVAIVSDRPQTTRRAIRGIATDTERGEQLVLVDLPGVQKPRDVLTERMQRRVERELIDADAVLLVINGEQGFGPGDHFIVKALLEALGDSNREEGTRVFCALNKTDRLSRSQTIELLTQLAAIPVIDEIFPVSARTGEGVETLRRRLGEEMPEGPFMYPPAQSVDQPSEVHLAELIREQVLLRTHNEVPHAVEVSVTEIEREDDLVSIHAQVWVESNSQKGILIGSGGKMIRDIGTAARKELEHELDSKVFLDLQVRVREKWRRDEGLLDRLGIE